MPLTCADAQARGLGHVGSGASGFEDPHKKPTTGARRIRPGPCARRTRSCRRTPPEGPCEPIRGLSRERGAGEPCRDRDRPGITVYPARCEGGRWRAVWYELDGSRGQCQSVSQQGLAARLEKVAERLAADAPNMLRTGSELIGYYLSDDRRPAERAWSRRHADTQRYLCARYLEPVIGQLASQDIRVADMQAAVNAAPTAKEGKRVRAMISALVGAGVSGGYLASDRLKSAHATACPENEWSSMS